MKLKGMKRMNISSQKYMWSLVLGVTIGLSMPGKAQAGLLRSSFSRIDSGEEVSSIVLQDSTHLSVRFSVTDGHISLSANERLIVQPFLCAPDGHEMSLPALEFSGKRTRKYFDRKAVLDKTERSATYAPGDTAHCSYTVQVEPWMRCSELSLELRREVENCCDIRPLESLSLETVSLVTPHFEPVIPHISVAEQIAVREPVLVPMSEYRPFNPDVPLRRMKDALYVHFSVGKSVLREDYRENKGTLERILDMVKRIEADSLSSVKKIRIVGLASPEGAYDLNVRLSRNRAQVLKDYLVQHGVQLPDSTYELIAGGEAWADLRDVLQESDLKDRDELLRIIDETPDLNRRETLLRQYNGGKSFQYLTQSVFVDQRNSGYIQVYYEAVPDAAAEKINRAAALTREGKPAEAIALIENLDDSRKWNTLGAALYLSGHKEEALDAFRKAVQYQNPGAEENLKVLSETQK